MEKIFLKLEFVLILALLVAPPIVFQFFAERPETISTVYPLRTFVLAFFAFTLYYVHRNVYIIRFQKTWTNFRILILSGESLVCFGLLCLIAVTLELIAFAAGKSSVGMKIIMPDNMNLWVNFIAGTICAGFYEEVLYRFYLPEAMRHLVAKFPRIKQIVPEAVAVMLFALGHIYLGIFGVANALLCGIVLRLCMWRTHSLWYSLVPHVLYNFCSFFVMSKLM